MKLKLISNGVVGGSQVVNAETGEVLQGVNEASWKIKAASSGGLPVATVTIELNDVEVSIGGNGLANLKKAMAEEEAKKKAAIEAAEAEAKKEAEVPTAEEVAVEEVTEEKKD